MCAKISSRLKSNIIKLPGLVDVHVHLREPGATHKEDFETGTKAAVAGGYTQILDMPNNVPPTVTTKDLEQKIKLAHGRIWCDVGFNFGATAHSAKFFKKISKMTCALKVYMNLTTGPLLVEKSLDRELIFKNWSNSSPIIVHAEGEALEVAIKLAKKHQRRLHITHILTEQIELIEKARQDRAAISCDVTPHHLFLTSEDIKKLGPLAIMKPPLGSVSDQQKLWRNLDKIDMIATDHGPHTLSEKESDHPPFGVPGLETTLPLMLWAVSKSMLSLKRLIEMTSINPRKIFNLPIQPNTYVEVDLSKKYLISNRGLFTKCGWTPFVGLEGRGEVKKVAICGQSIFENGKFVGKPQGKVIYPT